MNFIQLLGTCPSELSTIVALVKTVITLICVAIPILLIVLIILDLAKIVTAGNLDDKLKKEVTNKVVTRLIFAVIIFLVPTIVKAVFTLIPLPTNITDAKGENATWRDCWENAKIEF